MQLTRFFSAGKDRFGVFHAGHYHDLSAGFASFFELAAALQAARPGLDEWLARGARFAPAEVSRLIPLAGSYRVFCAALNYRDHVKEVGLEVPSQPLFFFKFPQSMISPDAPIVIPEVTRFLDYEGELGVVIGRSGRDIAEEHALQHVLGYCVINEVSARDLQVRKDGARPVVDWFSGKALDAIAPIGPTVVTADEVGDASDLRLQTRLNGETVQDTRTSQLIFSIPHMISYISRRTMLQPFDVIATGTTSGVGHARGRPLQPGDTVEIEIERVGVLSSRVVAPGASAPASGATRT